MVVELLYAIAQKNTNYVRTADVEIAEVGAVGFVNVIVTFREGRASGGDCGLEKGGWAIARGSEFMGGKLGTILIQQH